MSWEEHQLTSYQDYFQSPWWAKLKEKYIYTNSRAGCFICHKKNTLLLHHVTYKALYKERLNRDIYTICYSCHEKIHFWLYRLIKVPLKTNALLFSMRLRRSIYCLQNRQIILSLLWLLVTVIIGLFYLLVWIVKLILVNGFKLLAKLLTARQYFS